MHIISLTMSIYQLTMHIISLTTKFQDKTLIISYLPEVITKMRRGGISTGGLKTLINKKKEDYWLLKNNKMPYPLWILLAKNISKIPQLFFRKR